MTPTDLKELRQRLKDEGFLVNVDRPSHNQVIYTVTNVNHFTTFEWPCQFELTYFCDGMFDHQFPRHVESFLQYDDHAILTISYG